MNNFQYIKNIILSKLMRKGNAYIVDKMRREGMKIGKDTHVYSNISLSETYLISIGSNTESKIGCKALILSLVIHFLSYFFIINNY